MLLQLLLQLLVLLLVLVVMLLLVLVLLFLQKQLRLPQLLPPLSLQQLQQLPQRRRSPVYALRIQPALLLQLLLLLQRCRMPLRVRYQ